MGLILRHSDNQPLGTCHKPSTAVRSHFDKLGAFKTYWPRKSAFNRQPVGRSCKYSKGNTTEILHIFVGYRKF